MGVTYLRLQFASRDRELVSRQLYVLLHDLHYRDRVAFNVNEGHRTEARQRQLIREKGLWHPTLNPTGAAPVSEDAPHIFSGRPNHALDLDNADAVIRAAAKRGVRLYRTMPASEPWHVVPDAGDLARYYNAHKARVLGIGSRELRPGSIPGEDVKRAMVMLRALGYFPAGRKVGTTYGPTVQKAVRSFKARHGLPHDAVLGDRAHARLVLAYNRRRK